MGRAIRRWAENVLRNSAVAKIPLGPLAPGKHTLRLIYRDPGVVFERIVVTFPSAPPAYPVPAPRGTTATPRVAHTATTPATSPRCNWEDDRIGETSQPGGAVSVVRVGGQVGRTSVDVRRSHLPLQVAEDVAAQT